MKDQEKEGIAIILAGCITISIALIIISASTLFYKTSSYFKKGRIIIYNEMISSNDSTQVWKKKKYTLTEISVDTISRKHFHNIIENFTNKKNNLVINK